MLALVPDLLIFRPEAAAAGDLAAALETGIVQFHHDFFLGPVNEVLHGGAVLVDDGFAVRRGGIYFLAGWFELAPIGYGTFGFLTGVLFALFFAAAYCVLRLAGTSRLLPRPRWRRGGRADLQPRVLGRQAPAARAAALRASDGW